MIAKPDHHTTAVHLLAACLIMVGGAWAAVRAQDVCEFYLDSCPSVFDGDTIRVPERVIAMGPRVHGCPADTTAASSNGPPSIMFIIDNSGSMSGLGSGPNDRMGSRFSVPLALLDSIYAAAPDAEVGVAVFQNRLYFDHRDDSFFVPLPGNVDGIPDQSYIPLSRLNQPRPDSRLTIDKLKEVMAIDTSVGRMADGTTQQYVHLKYVPGDTSDLTLYTNINVGFMAALEAFKATARPKGRQFIIFFSDGEPLGSQQAGLNPDYFQQGTNVPTTFTVFFTSSNTAPQSLSTMTRNIAGNGYSSANPASELWTIATSHDTLLSLLTDQVIGTILASAPSGMVVSAVSLSDTSTAYINGYFVFPERFPLQRTLTPFSIPLLYRYTMQGTDSLRDTVVHVNFTVRRVAGTVPDRPGVVYSCWTRSLQFAYQGTVTSLLRTDMAGIDVRLSTTDTRAGATQVTFYAPGDSETVTLANAGQYWSSPLMLSHTATPSYRDGTLQYLDADSIVVVYRNPKLPLDTIRTVIRIVDVSGPAVRRALFFPGPRDGVDTLRVVFNGPVNCQKLTSVPPESVFVYFDSAQASPAALHGAVFVGQCQSTYVSEALILVRRSQFVINPWQDSIAFVMQSRYVADTSGTLPPAQSIRAAIEYGKPVKMECVVAPNPASTSKPIDAAILRAYANVVGNATYGTVISVYSTVPLKQIMVGSTPAYGKAEIYDAVANIVANNLPVVATGRPGVYGVYWNLRNRNSRGVGYGTYMANVTTTDINNQKAVRRVMIGVQR